jgi:hypothetical protein
METPSMNHLHHTLTYVSDPFLVTPALNGQTAILHAVLDGVVVTHNLIVSGGSTFYDLDHVSFYDLDPDPFYGTSLRIPINGSVVLQEGVCQLETIIMSSATVNKITELALLVDVIDIVEYIEDITVDILGSVIPYTSNFSVIKNITATLQANNTNAFVVRVDKTTNLAPLLKVFDVSNTAIGGAKVDVIIKGY